MQKPDDYNYDEEIYANLFCVGFENARTLQYDYFEISPRRNDILQLAQFVNSLSAAESRAVGFNNIGFDYPILHMILTDDPHTVTLESIFNKCQAIINTPFNRRFDNTVWERDHIVMQIDLFKLNHYDNANKGCSLKQLEFAMRMDSIQDLPYKPGSTLTYEEMDHVASYMKHDITATRKFYEANEWAIALRESLSETYSKNMLNMSDSKIGSEILVQKLNEAGIETHEYVEVFDYDTKAMVRKKQPRITERPSICLGDVIFDNVQFESAPFKALLTWIKNKTITETKAALSNIPYDAELFKYLPANDIKIPDLPCEDCNGKFKPVKNRKTRLSTAVKNDVQLDLSKYEGVTCDSLSVINGGFQYDLGTGGIHGSVSSQIVTSDDDYVVADYDFASWYPHLSFKNGVYPEHLGLAFCSIYEGMYHERKSYPKSNPINYALKIALNGSYGNSNSRFSPFYDPKFTMTITMNGQLYLCMLAEQFMKIPGLSVIQVNTDGVTVRTPRKYLPHVRNIVKWIEQVTSTAMEEVIYSRMLILNVNNYIAEYAQYEYLYAGEWLLQGDLLALDISTKDLPSRELRGQTGGKCKRKNAYMVTKDKQWHQSQSSPIVAMAANEALLNGEDIRGYIENHTDIYDFMIMVKVPKKSWLRIENTDIQLTSRVYASDHPDAGQIYEWRNPKKNAASQERKPNKHFSDVDMKLANNMSDASFDDINYDYYVKEAEKLVLPLINGNIDS